MSEGEIDFRFDVPLDDEYQAGDNKYVVTINISAETPATELKSEVLADEDTSSSTDLKLPGA